MSKTSLSVAAVAALVLTAAVARAQTPPPSIDLQKAKDAFAEAHAVSEKEGGRLWGIKLYGAMFFVDPETRFTVANEPDPQGVLHAEDGLYVGTLPKEVIVSNAPVEWEGKRWTMLMWPLYYAGSPELPIMFGHEMFHRIQPLLHLEASDAPNLQLDTPEGRLWLQLEWRALAAALVEHGSAREKAIRDALLFRDHRHALFPGSAKSEASLEIAEGIPEYTGTMAGSPDLDSARWRAIGKLANPDQTITFPRSFAYTSGPPYGMLLDQRMPGWRKKLTKDSDLGAMLEATLHGPAGASADARAKAYGAAMLKLAEADRAAKEATEKAKYRALLVDGPTLTLPGLHLNFSFNPSTLISLGDAGTVYPVFHVQAAWGTLDVNAGVLVPTDFSRITVAAPKDVTGSHIEGPGWTLDLAPGWSVVAADRAGSYTVKKI
ncbi:MAG TPA: hypothetical protein VMU22_12460 [Rhizomicrobium sp.]|nr:hypothetical protein [Rhizomicrobium sp.]